MAAALAFACALLAAAGLQLLLPVEGRASAGDRVQRLVALLALAGRRLRPITGGRVPLDLEARMAAAGLSGRAAGLGTRELMAAKLALAALAGAAALSVGAVLPGRLGIAAAVAAPVSGFLAPDLWLHRRAAERFRRVRRELPATLDLLRVTVEGGLPLSDAIEAVGARAGGPLGEEWRLLGREVALGVPLQRALEAMRRRLPMPEVAALVGALERSVRHGAPLATTLEAQARDVRHARRRRIQEEAARAGPKIQLVVALLLVPSVLLLVAAALAAALVEGGGGLAIG